MSDTETFNHEITIRLTTSGKLPATIPCQLCYRPMHRKLKFRKVVYACGPCGAETTLDFAELKEMGLQ